MREKRRSGEQQEATRKLFFRVTPSVDREFREQADRAHRKLTGHFVALVERGRGVAVRRKAS